MAHFARKIRENAQLKRQKHETEQKNLNTKFDLINDVLSQHFEDINGIYESHANYAESNDNKIDTILEKLAGLSTEINPHA